MEWSDEGIVLSLRPHGESSGILDALTRAHGRHTGLVRGGVSPKRRAMLQPGNRVRLTWRARLSENLGIYVAELAEARAHEMFERRSSLLGLNAFVAVAAAALPEREPHGPAFEGAEAMLAMIAEHEFADWAPLYVHWEMGLLDELGFGLDLSRCAATGTSENLIYVSPKSGRAVSAEPGAPYRGRMLSLPAFLRNGGRAESSAQDILDGLKLTAHFLEQSVLLPHGHGLPEARQRLSEFAARALRESR
jgi:DNA repair protein RecO (recombination protein O)